MILNRDDESYRLKFKRSSALDLMIIREKVHAD